jgi:hypothetical protein
MAARVKGGNEGGCGSGTKAASKNSRPPIMPFWGEPICTVDQVKVLCSTGVATRLLQK